MITKIGITAGAIWELLDENKEVELSRLLSSVDHSRDLILMSLGWLTREGYVTMSRNNRSCKVALRRKEEWLNKIRCPDLKEGRQNTCLAFREVLMTPSLYETEKFCLSEKYEDCPWRIKSKLY